MRMKVLATVLLALIALGPFACQEAPADQATYVNLNGFRVGLYDPQVEFPNSISFDLAVEAESDISRIALHYQTEKLSPVPVTSIVFPSFETASEAKASWKWDMRKTGGLPPGTRIRYWWAIQDAEGNSAETGVASVTFADQHHAWESLATDRITLYWYQGSSSFAQQLLNAAEGSLDRLATEIGAELSDRAQVYVYAGTQDLRNAMIYPPEWTGGVAYTEYGIVAIGISTDDLVWGKRAMAHELAHLVVHRLVYSGYDVGLPTWLDEGLAMYIEGELSSYLTAVLNDAVAHQELFSIRSLCGSFPTATQEAYLAYAQSYSLVEFLLQEEMGGKGNVLQLLDCFKQGSGYVDALDQVYGLDIDQLDGLWRQYVG